MLFLPVCVCLDIVVVLLLIPFCRFDAGGDPEVQKEEGHGEEDIRHKVMIRDLEGR